MKISMYMFMTINLFQNTISFATSTLLENDTKKTDKISENNLMPVNSVTDNQHASCSWQVCSNFLKIF
jgi:hypothetical protein